MQGHRPRTRRIEMSASRFETEGHALRERSRLQLLIAWWSSSFFWRALLVAVPNGLCAMLLSIYATRPTDQQVSAVGVGQIWTGYNFVLGFLVVFRTTHSYGRYWEGATLLHQIRGEWFNAVSCLFAFCSPAPEKRAEVEHFQNLVVRLTSMLHCAALQQVTVMEIKEFQTIEIEGMDPEALQFLMQKAEKTEVLLQWIQRLVVDAASSGVLPIAPPILSRVFQELSRGIVNLNNARKITDVPFPSPYTIMINVMLAIQWIVTPLVAASVTQSWMIASGLSLITVFAFWSTVHIAAEIENPFGDDPNDLPLVDYQIRFNQSLLTLLDVRAQVPPFYAFTRREGRHLGVREMSSSCVEWLTPVLDDEMWRGKSLAVHRIVTMRHGKSRGSQAKTVSSTASIKSVHSANSAPSVSSGFHPQNLARVRESPLHGTRHVVDLSGVRQDSTKTHGSLADGMCSTAQPTSLREAVIGADLQDLVLGDEPVTRHDHCGSVEKVLMANGTAGHPPLETHVEHADVDAGESTPRRLPPLAGSDGGHRQTDVVLATVKC